MHALHRLPILGLVVLVAGCAAPATPVASPTPATESPIPTDRATATTAPTAAPVATAEPTTEPPLDPVETEEPSRGVWAQDPPAPLLVNAAVRVLVPELNVREQPSTSAPRVGRVTLDQVIAVRGLPPVEADGYIWYFGIVVSATGELPSLPAPLFGNGDALAGWFAATKGGASYVARLGPRCPTVVDLVNVAAMLPAERLACLDDGSIEVKGTFGCLGCLSHLFGDYRPSWLSNPNLVDFLWDVPMEGSGLKLRFPPGGPDQPAQGSIVRVRGHLRDDAAANCRVAMDYPWDGGVDSHDVPAAVARLLCRQEFVVERYDVLGSDPRFPE